jgi:hypothetical protein
MRSWMLAALPLFTAAPLVIAAAQETPRPPVPHLATGARVRVRSPAIRAFPHRVVGTLTALSGDTMQVTADGGAAPVALPLGSIEWVDMSVGRRSAGKRFVRGAGYGLLFGAVAGGAIGIASGDDPADEFLAFTAPEKAAILGIGFGAIGVVVGGLVGLGGEPDIWRRVDSAGGGLRVTAAPDRGGRGVRFGVTLAF